MTTIIEGNQESLSGHIEAFENLTINNNGSRNLSQVPRVASGYYGDKRPNQIIAMPDHSPGKMPSVQPMSRNASIKRMHSNVLNDPSLPREKTISQKKKLNKVSIRQVNLEASSPLDVNAKKYVGQSKKLLYGGIA